MKVVGLAVARTGADINEPIPLTVINDLSSFGFFQRQVCLSDEEDGTTTTIDCFFFSLLTDVLSFVCVCF